METCRVFVLVSGKRFGYQRNGTLTTRPGQVSVQILREKGATIATFLPIEGGERDDSHRSEWRHHRKFSLNTSPGRRKRRFCVVLGAFFLWGVPLRRSRPPPAPPEAAWSNFGWISVAPGHHFGACRGTWAPFGGIRALQEPEKVRKKTLQGRSAVQEPF